MHLKRILKNACKKTKQNIIWRTYKTELKKQKTNTRNTKIKLINIMRICKKEL